jgi:hypothetical protein
VLREELGLRPFLAIWALSLIALGGCGADDGKIGNPVSGSITLHGQPLDQGTIEFLPAAGQGTYSGGPIKEGRYSVPGENGLEPGMYQVKITSMEGGAANVDEAPGEPGPPQKQRIPAEFNSATTLKRDVIAGQENIFDFAIP